MPFGLCTVPGTFHVLVEFTSGVYSQDVRYVMKINKYIHMYVYVYSQEVQCLPKRPDLVVFCFFGFFQFCATNILGYH